MTEPIVAAIMPSIPPRHGYRNRAVVSIQAQTRWADHTQIHIDHEGVGAATARNDACQETWKRLDGRIDWFAFLDDDDTWYPWHLETLLAGSEDADLVFSKFDGCNTTLEQFKLLDVPFDAESARHIREVGNFIPMTCLVRASMLHDVGWFTPPPWASPDNPCEDWGTWIKMLDAGARFVGVPRVTWTWHGHGAHTSGRPWPTIPAYRQG